MSKQFQIYALPDDVEDLIVSLRRHLEVELISPTASYPEPVHLASPIRNGSILQGKQSRSVNCYMTRGDLADVRLKRLTGESLWRVDEASEVVSLTGFDFDGETLLRGRMYFQNDYLLADQILCKRDVFLQWANEVFSRSKKLLTRSRQLDVYMGNEARSWALKGGKLASFVAQGRQPIYEAYSEE